MDVIGFGFLAEGTVVEQIVDALLGLVGVVVLAVIAALATQARKLIPKGVQWLHERIKENALASQLGILDALMDAVNDTVLALEERVKEDKASGVWQDDRLVLAQLQADARNIVKTRLGSGIVEAIKRNAVVDVDVVIQALVDQAVALLRRKESGEGQSDVTLLPDGG